MEAKLRRWGGGENFPPGYPGIWLIGSQELVMTTVPAHGSLSLQDTSCSLLTGSRGHWFSYFMHMYVCGGYLCAGANQCLVPFSTTLHLNYQERRSSLKPVLADLTSPASPFTPGVHWLCIPDGCRMLGEPPCLCDIYMCAGDQSISSQVCVASTLPTRHSALAAILDEYFLV